MPGDTPEHLEVIGTSDSASTPTLKDADVRKRRSAPKKFASTVKRIAWRATGLFFWFGTLKQLFGANEDHSVLSDRIATYLSLNGFSPVDARHLATITKVGWVLVVTSFKPIEMLGLAIYLVFFPFLPLIIYLTYGIEASENKSAIETSRQLGLAANSSRRLAIPVCSLSLLAWFILFGDSGSKKPMILGVVLAGLLFFLFAARAFQRVRPAHEPDPNFLRVAKITGVSLLQGVLKQLQEGSIKTKTAAILSKRFYQPLSWFYRRMALWTRGKHGRNRIYLFVLAEYVASLILLASTTILFWSMADKAILAPTTLPLKYFVGLVSSSIFPGIPPYIPPQGLPRLFLIAPSISAWILFVLYAGPASSNLGVRQAAYAHNVEIAHRIFRRLMTGYNNCLKILKKLEKHLP